MCLKLQRPLLLTVFTNISIAKNETENNKSHLIKGDPVVELFLSNDIQETKQKLPFPKLCCF